MEGIIERDLARKALIEKRKEEKGLSLAEKSQVFFQDLDQSIGALKAQLRECKNLEKSSLPGVFEELIIQSRMLQTNVTRMNGVLSAYDIQKAQKDVSTLEQTIRSYKLRLIPKQPFTFEKAREKQRRIWESQGGERAGEEGETEEVQSQKETLKKVEERKKNEKVRMETLASNFLHLKNYEDSILEVLDAELFALKIDNIVGSKMFCGPVKGSIFVENCRDCVFELTCAQLRVHDCENCVFNLIVKSDPIIEDSTNLVFTDKYPENMFEGQMAGFEGVENRYRHVKDFNCPIQNASRNFECK